MQRQITFQQYRTIDLIAFAVMITFSEFLTTMATTHWFPNELYTVSVAAPLVAIVYMRWKWWGAIHAAFAGLIFSFFYGGTFDQSLIYTVGNLFSVLAVFMLYRPGYERVRQSVALSLLFGALVWFLMVTGRAVVSLILGWTIDTAILFCTEDALSLLFTLVVIWVARRLDGVFENQKHYLLRIQDEDKDNDEIDPESDEHII